MEKYKKIIDKIQKKINSGEYPAGSRLPSLKKAAEIFGCAEETVVKAYREMVQMHIIYVKRNSGHYVAKTKEQESRNKGRVNLASGNVEIDNFPLVDSQTNLVQAIEAYRSLSLNYELRGVGSLLETLQNHLQKYNIFVDQSQIFMNQGILQTFSMICQSEFLDGSVILIENPTYLFSLKMLEELALPVIGINRTIEGFDLDELEELFQKEEVRFFYVTPYNHNPLGANLTNDQIRKIAELARKYDVIVVENDYFLEGPIYTRRETIFEHLREQCFYLSSYTKIFPFLRTGFLLVPERYIKEWERVVARDNLFGYVSPSLLSQATLEVMIQNGTMNKFQKDISKKIKGKRKELTQITKEWDMEVARLMDGKAGYYAVILLNEQIPVKEFISTLAQQQILIGRMQNRFIDTEHPYRHSVRISLSFIDKKQMKSVFEQVYQCALALIKKESDHLK